MSIPTSILFWMQLNWTKLIHFMEFETHGILFQKAFSVLPLQFTALISKARKAYDSSRFKACFPWHFSFQLWVFAVALMKLTRSQHSLLTLLVREWSRETITACERGAFSSHLLSWYLRERREATGDRVTNWRRRKVLTRWSRHGHLRSCGSLHPSTRT